jgi:ABC-type sugar transport system substrate-binding protein
MAIGALEIVQAIAKEKPENHLPKIIGYDGIPKMLWLIKNGNPHILGTINVKVEKQAEQALATMTAMLEGQRPNILLGLITPESVPNIAVLEM